MAGVGRATRRVLSSILVAGTVIAVLPASGAGAATGGFADRINDVWVYDWERDYGTERDWDWVDITEVNVNATSTTLELGMRILNLQANFWDGAQFAVEVNGDNVEDYALTIIPSGDWALSQKQGWQDLGTNISCSGLGVGIDYGTGRVSASIPRGCIGNTGSVAIKAVMYSEFPTYYDQDCCYNTAIDAYPDGGQATYSSRVAFDGGSTPPPSAGYDPNGPTGTIYRLYRAYFLREPDKSGYDYWYGVFRDGYPLTDISENFTRSQEFQSRYGTLDNAQFIRRVYLNVLEREPDPDGYSYWANQMQNGMPRGVVMINFSDSAEFRAKTASGRPPGY